ncbi:hypothetical protein HY988_02865 [Candidatus Micrarchaeota archaeon]|nr:hypothetical protein [Candidatus Micrarchaeota archaeon]
MRSSQLPFLLLLAIFITTVTAQTSIPTPSVPQDVQQAGHFVDAINRQYEAQVLIARTVPEGYQITVNPGVTAAPGQLQTFSKRLSALGFKQEGTDFFYFVRPDYPNPPQAQAKPPINLTPASPFNITNSTNTTRSRFNQPQSISPVYLAALGIGGILFLATALFLAAIAFYFLTKPKPKKRK